MRFLSVVDCKWAVLVGNVVLVDVVEGALVVENVTFSPTKQTIVFKSTCMCYETNKHLSYKQGGKMNLSQLTRQ